MAVSDAPSSLKRKRESSSGRPIKRHAPDVPLEENHLLEWQSSETSEDDSGTSLTSPAETPLTPVTPVGTPKSYSCPYDDCDKVFFRRSHLDLHAATHTNDRPFSCDERDCGKTFRRQSHLNRHVKSAHTDIRDYVCTAAGCDKSYTTGTRLRRHVQTHGLKKEYRCQHDRRCRLSFHKKSHLQKHVRIDHLGIFDVCEYVDQETGEKCGAKFDSPKQLESHVRRAHSAPRYVCSICSDAQDVPEDEESDWIASIVQQTRTVSFRTAADLREHNTAAHPPICRKCDRKFANHRELELHVYNKHSGKPLDERRTCPCPYTGCGRAFTRRSNLNVHIRHFHEGIKPFVCSTEALGSSSRIEGWDAKDACGATYSAKASLLEHVRVHHLGQASKMTNVRRGKREQIAARRGVPATEANKLNPSSMALLTGAGYAEESGRELTCPQSGCNHLFARRCDREAHVLAVHQQEAIEAFATEMEDFVGCEELNEDGNSIQLDPTNHVQFPRHRHTASEERLLDSLRAAVGTPVVRWG